MAKNLEHLQELSCTENDIVDAHYVEPKLTISSESYNGHYMVIFKDEPDMKYYDGITKRGKQIQKFCEKDKLSSDGVTKTKLLKMKPSTVRNCANSL